MTFENIVENGAFAHEEQMLHFREYFKKHFNSDIFSSIRFSSFSSDAFLVDKAKNSIWSKGLTGLACARDFKYFEVHVSV